MNWTLKMMSPLLKKQPQLAARSCWSVTQGGYPLAQLYKIKLNIFFFNYLYNNKDWTVNERRFPVEGVEGEPVLLRGEQQLPSTTLYRKICNIP